MKLNHLWILLLVSSLFFSCKENSTGDPNIAQVDTLAQENFNYTVEEFADIKILRYQIPGWENLSLKEQKLVYYLVEAGLAGRDIMWDQNYRHNLKIREALENIYTTYQGEK